MSVAMRSQDGSKCLVLNASRTVTAAENLYHVSFRSSPALDTLGRSYNYWIFPLAVQPGMFTSRLKINGFLIPPSCNSKNATFINLDFIPRLNTLLYPNVSIDASTVTIRNVYTGNPPGMYTAGDLITIVVEFSRDVSFTELPSVYSDVYQHANASYKLPVGLPYIELNSLSYATLRGYEAGSVNHRKLSFLYRVSTGEYTPVGGRLEIPDGNTIVLNSANIVAEDSGVPVDLTSMPGPGTVGSLSSAHAPVITVNKTGEKFPPHGYNPSALPGGISAADDAVPTT
eukprot:CAMPEP_0113685742 /NCGR_PEP_ID=MMETSP0038_2-20120614/14864_1 /TAXON_ID=2898 /ORGANISM="Cryptomonas paramecium" /LENGTH=285 /DNA_ID=CAMNT_0000605909 /DNA_START=263 /DNA_END=1117 /DNA_ORIENTATION=+ /assembly_acc=CAM_ASM_000170